jgi:hypothetical protein
LGYGVSIEQRRSDRGSRPQATKKPASGMLAPHRARNGPVTVLTIGARRQAVRSGLLTREKGDIDFAFFLAYQRC